MLSNPCLLILSESFALCANLENSTLRYAGRGLGWLQRGFIARARRPPHLRQHDQPPADADAILAFCDQVTARLLGFLRRERVGFQSTNSPADVRARQYGYQPVFASGHSRDAESGAERPVEGWTVMQLILRSVIYFTMRASRSQL